MAEIVKELGKSEYNIKKIGEVGANVLIGGKDATVGNKVVPNSNISWECFSGGEKYFINLNRKGVTVDTEQETFSNGELGIKVGDNTDIWKIVDGKMKWNIKFDKKPLTNVFEWEMLNTDGMRFLYQGTSEETWILESHNGTRFVFGMDYAAYMAHENNHPRIEKVIGSYAVYTKRKHKGGLLASDGSTIQNYKTGKLGHIYRPLCIDDDGKEEWAVLSIDENKNPSALSITIPQAFLDNAKYPVVLDPTIGFTAIGGTSAGYNDNFIIGSRFIAPAAGNANPGTLYCYLRSDDEAVDQVHSVYESEAGDTVAGADKLSVGNLVVTNITSAGWYNGSITWLNIIADTDYFIGYNGEDVDGGEHLHAYYDISETGGYEDGEYVARVYDTTMPSPFPGGLSSVQREISIYIDYSILPASK